MRRLPTPTRTPLALVVLLLAGLATTACESDAFGAGRTRIMLSLVEVSGNQQTLAAGGAQSAPLVVRLVDQDGKHWGGMTVDWKLSQGTGTLSAASTTSDANGLVQVTYASGDEPGATVVTASFNPAASGASASRQIDPVVFTITVE